MRDLGRESDHKLLSDATLCKKGRCGKATPSSPEKASWIVLHSVQNGPAGCSPALATSILMLLCCLPTGNVA